MRILRRPASRHAPAALLLLASFTYAQVTLTNAPNLSTATETSAAATSAASKQTSNAATTGTSTSASDSASKTTSGTSVFSLSDAPTIAGAGIPTQVVPYTANAPYMQKSSLPSGTVFICVGAILGFLGMCVLAWRGLVAWSLHRSVRRAAAQSTGFHDTKNPLLPPGGGGGKVGQRNSVYPNGNDKGSSLSLDHLTRAAHRHTHRVSHVDRRQSQHGGAKPPSSLFFSPTAGAGLHTPASNQHLGVHGSRSSTYLPAGYYASGSSGTPASTTVGTTADIHPALRQPTNPLHSLGLGGPQASGYARAQSYVGPSPPDSPVSAGPPSRGADSVFGANSRPSSSIMGVAGATSLYERPSSSSLNLMAPRGGDHRLSATPAPGERAPSAYLEDLFENHGHGMR